jgi:hypothetical protein
LHDQALKNLHLEPDQFELARHGVAERLDATAALEEVPERLIVDAVASLRKVAWICLSGRRL